MNPYRKLFQLRAHLISTLILFVSLAPLAAANDGDAFTRATQTLENATTRLTFSTDVDLRLLSVENLTTGAVFNFKDKEPWRILCSELTSGSWLTVHPDTHSNTFNYTFTNHGSYKEIVATWEDFIIDGSNAIDLVTVTATLANDDILAEMKIDVDCTLTDYSLFKIFFPEFNIRQIGASSTDDFLTYPEHGGYIIDDPINNATGKGWPHPGWWSMQFFSYFDDSGCLFLATDDTEGYIKIFAFVGDAGDNSLYWRLESYPEDHTHAETDYNMPYQFKIGPLDGDWYDATQFYKSWALDNIVTRKRIDDPDTDFPPILLDIDGLVGYGIGYYWYGLTPDILQGILDSKDYYEVDKTAIILYGWHNEPGTATSWPEVTPVPNVEPGIVTLHNEGDLIWLYTQMAWDSTLPSYVSQNIVQYVSKDIDLVPHSYLTLHFIDPSLQFWQDFTRDWNVDFTEDLDVDGIYWDFWSGQNKADYDETHGHPVGGGNYLAQGKLTQVQMTRDAVQQIPGREEWFLGSEYVNEFFVDTNEIEMWNGDSWSPQKMPHIRLPMYEVAFGDRQYVWALVQTNPISEEGWDNQISYTRAARMTIGMILGFSGDWADPFDPGASTHGHESFEFIGKLLRSYDYSRQYTLHGELMKTVQVNSVGSIPFESILPVSIYDIGNFWIHTPSYPEISFILPSVWQSYDKNGRESFGIVLINWYESQQSINYTFKFDDYGMTKGRYYSFVELDETGATKIARYKDDFTRNETLEKRSIKVFAIKPETYTEKLKTQNSKLTEESGPLERVPSTTR